MERELASVEKQLKTFEKSFNTAVEPILSAKFDDRGYGNSAVEKKINDIIQDSKTRIEKKYNDYLNGVRRAAYDSTERIKREALVTSQETERLNKSLSEWATLNNAFEAKEYRLMIMNADRLETQHFDKELKDSLLILKLEAFDNLCRSNIDKITESTYADYTTYFSLCSDNNATHHLVRSAVLLLQASATIIEPYANEKKQLYFMCKNGLSAYSVLPDNERTRLNVEYQKCYSNGIELYNELSERAYNEFDYPFVKELIADSKLFKQVDIRAEFFKSGKTDPKTLFDYYNSHGQNATSEIVDMVYDDTKGLLDTSEYEKYSSYWITRYDDYKLKYVTRIVNAKEDTLSTFRVLITALLENGISIINGPECLYDLANFYKNILLAKKDTVNLLAFAKNAILWNTYIKLVQANAISGQNEAYIQGAKIIDEISYPMIDNYKKLCNGLSKEIIAELNIVMDATSMRLFGKRYTKNLKCTEENSTSPNTTVKLISMDQIAKNRKTLFLGCLIWAILIMIVVVIVVLCK